MAGIKYDRYGFADPAESQGASGPLNNPAMGGGYRQNPETGEYEDVNLGIPKPKDPPYVGTDEEEAPSEGISQRDYDWATNEGLNAPQSPKEYAGMFGIPKVDAAVQAEYLRNKYGYGTDNDKTLPNMSDKANASMLSPRVAKYGRDNGGAEPPSPAEIEESKIAQDDARSDLSHGPAKNPNSDAMRQFNAEAGHQK